MMLNMGDGKLNLEVPALEGWRLLKVIDTALPSPIDIAGPGEAMAVPASMCSVNGHRIVVLVGT